MDRTMTTPHLDTSRHPIGSESYRSKCRTRLDRDGAFVLKEFVTRETVALVVSESARQEPNAFYATDTHNVYLTPPDPKLPAGHLYNRQVASSKGLIADDQIPADSPLREIYEDAAFRAFLSDVLGVEELHPYDDDLSSINVHFAAKGLELGWHFDNSSFAVTMLLQAPERGGLFQYVPGVRDADRGEMAYERCAAILDGEEPVRTLPFDPGDLVLFRGRDALHRVTPTEGSITRMLVVFAFNDRPGIALSDSALSTFYGRTS
jgi:hypothetical protein